MPFDRNRTGRSTSVRSAGTDEWREFRASRVHRPSYRPLVLHTLYKAQWRARTQFFVEWMALDLIRNAEGDVLGVTALEMETAT
jgi:succinate dehydrogenase / fumarate reductase flavoprotein subunit